MIEAPSLVFDNESAVAAMIVMNGSGTPMFAGSERDLPIFMRKALPPFEFNDPFKPKSAREVADAPGHDPDFWSGKLTQGGLMEMVEVGVGQQNQINRRQVLDLEAGPLDPFDEEQPVGKVGVNQDVEIRDLHEKRRVTNPGQRHLAIQKIGKTRSAMLPVPFGDESFPDHFMEKRAWIEMIAGSQFLE